MTIRYQEPARSQLVRAVDLARVMPEPPEPEATIADRLLAARDIDPVEWQEANFYIPPMSGFGQGDLIRFMPHQKVITRYIFTRGPEGRFPFQNILISSIKKSGKTTLVASWGRWLAETQVRYGELYTIGNDQDQAKEREYKFIRESIELTPGYDYARERLQGRWTVQAKTLKCTASNTSIKAIAQDAPGEAGGRPYCSMWTELWGFEHEAALRLWTEMTPVPTVPDSMRIVESYAGFEGESEQLWQLYDRGKTLGRQLTNGEVARVAARDRDGERYEDLLHAFAETGGDPEALVPLWVDGRFFMYWDEAEEARRNPAIQTPEYYAEEAKTNTPQQFARIHMNQWGSPESSFVPIEAWMRCYDPDLPPLTTTEPMILSLDAAATRDCFAAVAVTRHPTDPKRAAIRAAKVWRPQDFPDKRIDFEEVWTWVADVCRRHRIVQVCYDPFQLEDMSQRIRRELTQWAEPFNQSKDRKIADRRLYDLIMQRELSWNLHDDAGADVFRRHIANANAKHQKDQDSTLLIVKKAENRKIDLVVAASMGVHRCLSLFMEAA